MDVISVIEELGRSNQGLVTSTALRSAGVSRQRLARGVGAGELVRVRRGVYASTPLPPVPRHVVTEDGVAPAYVLRVRAVLLALGSTVAACGRTASALYGWGLLVEPSRTVELAVPHGWGSASRHGVHTTQRRAAATSRVRVLAGTTRLRLTSPAQTVVDCALGLPLLEAVVVCDSALRSGRVTLEELVRTAASLPGALGAEKARRVIAMADPASGSVLESVLRVRLVLSGIPGFVTQAVLGPGLRVDFCFAESSLVVEVDGKKWHQDAARDRARDKALALLGWRVLRLTWAEVVHHPGQAIEDIRTALAATATLHLPGHAAEQAA